ncbi:hypothetical protein BJX64DRAFT_246404 [Aspergillus heterothallicus]
MQTTMPKAINYKYHIQGSEWLTRSISYLIQEQSIEPTSSISRPWSCYVSLQGLCTPSALVNEPLLVHRVKFCNQTAAFEATRTISVSPPSNGPCITSETQMYDSHVPSSPSPVPIGSAMAPYRAMQCMSYPCDAISLSISSPGPILESSVSVNQFCDGASRFIALAGRPI